jgi:hypothetical protein
MILLSAWTGVGCLEMVMDRRHIVLNTDTILSGRRWENGVTMTGYQHLMQMSMVPSYLRQTHALYLLDHGNLHPHHLSAIHRFPKDPKGLDCPPHLVGASQHSPPKENDKTP